MTQESTPTLEPCLSDEIIPDLNNIVRAVEDEGDRCYLGSTNDAERLREIANWLETKFRRTPPASQSDEALVEELKRALAWHDYEMPIDEIEQGGPSFRQFQELMDGAYDHLVRTIVLPILAARIASARAEGRREGIEGIKEAVILKGIGKINGDGFKDTTKIGEVVFVWNKELPSPYAPGLYPRVGNEVWAASREQYDFQPATVAEVQAILHRIRREGIEEAAARLDECEAPLAAAIVRALAEKQP